jgi:membrane-associated phospholipid phosphatase
MATARAVMGARILTLLLMTAMVASKGWQEHIGLGFTLAGMGAVLWAPVLRGQGVGRWWFYYVAGIFLYTLLRSLADETSITASTGYPIQLDETLAFGRNPTLALQQEFFDWTAPNWLDRAAVAWHWSFFILPHAWGAAVFVFDRKKFPGFALAMLLTWYAGLLMFFIVPTTPPWLAAQEGALPGVFRIMDFVGRDAAGSAYNNVQATFGEPNSVAAMPSLHIAITWLLVLFAVNTRRWAGGLLGAYCLLMAAALLYLGEHYVVDMIAGAVMATLCYKAAMRWTKFDSSSYPAINGR